MHPPKMDAAEFAARLKEAMVDCGISIARGAGVALAKKYGASVVTANAWLKGEHRADTDRAQHMAQDLGVEFEWLYFGIGPKRKISRGVMEDPGIFDPSSFDPLSLLPPRERALLENYRKVNESTKSVVDAVFAASAQQEGKNRGKHG